MNKRKDLEKEIEKLESKLRIEEQGSNVWDTGKYKNPHRATAAKLLVKSRRDQINELKAKLDSLDDGD